MLKIIDISKRKLIVRIWINIKLYRNIIIIIFIRYFIVNHINDSREKAVLILCEYNGKTEFFEKGNTIDYTANKKIQSQVNSKVSGWVSSWINYYFEKHFYFF